MEKFFIDNSRSISDINASYSGKSMGEIIEIEDRRTDAIRDEVDALHDKFVEKGREKMLTVQKLIDYLKTQDPNACILAYEPNSFAYIEQSATLPNSDICTVAEDKVATRKNLEHWYKGTKGAKFKVERDLDKTYRYAHDNDVIIKFC